jgi:hypothetical protein
MECSILRALSSAAPEIQAKLQLGMLYRASIAEYFGPIRKATVLRQTSRALVLSVFF